jgi:hypothetical protein
MKITKFELKEMIREILKEELSKKPLTEASRKNPAPPATIEIVKIEPTLQEPYADPTRHFRHIDKITYIDPIFGTEQTAQVAEESPGFGNYFGWGAKHSGHWDYAAYSYEGKLLPGLNPSDHLSAGMKSAFSGLVDKINNPD